MVVRYMALKRGNVTPFLCKRRVESTKVWKIHTLRVYSRGFRQSLLSPAGVYFTFMPDSGCEPR